MSFSSDFCVVNRSQPLRAVIQGWRPNLHCCCHPTQSSAASFVLDKGPERVHRTQVPTPSASRATKDQDRPVALQRMRRQNRSLEFSPARIPDMEQPSDSSPVSPHARAGRLSPEYLDETSRRKVSLRERADIDQQESSSTLPTTRRRRTLGQVHAGGFYTTSIRMNPDGSSTAPSQLPTPERKRHITETNGKNIYQILFDFGTVP